MSEAGREEEEAEAAGQGSGVSRCRRQRGRATEEETAARPTVGALRGTLGDMGLAIGMSLTKVTTVTVAVTGEEKVM
jgi:hypothetical protein